MRAVALVMVGVALGVALTFLSADAAGGWYTYRTLSAPECGIAGEILGRSWTVAPHQPNPCHFRQPRWHVLY